MVRYKSENLIEPLVKDILSTELRGSVCVLTHTNDEALQVSGLLLKNGMPARLIQNNSESAAKNPAKNETCKKEIFRYEKRYAATRIHYMSDPKIGVKPRLFL